MAQYHMQVRIDMASGVPADSVVNTYHLSGPATPSASDYEDVAGAVWAAVYDNSSATQCFSELCSTGSTHLIKIFAEEDPEPRVPRYMANYTGLNAFGTGVGPLPPEVALCLSWKAADVAGGNPRRRRNRVYIGPLCGVMIDDSGQVSASGLLQAGAMLTDLLDIGTAAPGWLLNVWSPTDEVGLTLDTAWVDNEFDTQRRRGRKATLRSTFTA